MNGFNPVYAREISNLVRIINYDLSHGMEYKGGQVILDSNITVQAGNAWCTIVSGFLEKTLSIKEQDCTILFFLEGGKIIFHNYYYCSEIPPWHVIYSENISDIIEASEEIYVYFPENSEMDKSFKKI